MAFLRLAFAVLRAEAPASYAELATHLMAASGRYQVGGERFTLTARAGRIDLSAGWRAAPHRLEVVVTTPRAVLDLVDGAASLERLLSCELLVVRADSEALLGLSAASRLVAAAAVTLRALQDEFERYRLRVLAAGDVAG